MWFPSLQSEHLTQSNDSAQTHNPMQYAWYPKWTLSNTEQEQNEKLRAFHATPEGQASLEAERAPINQQIQDAQEVLKQKGLSKDDKQQAKDMLKELKAQLAEINSRPGAIPEGTTPEGTPKTFQERLDEHRAQREAQEKQAAELAQNTQFHLFLFC